MLREVKKYSAAADAANLRNANTRSAVEYLAGFLALQGVNVGERRRRAFAGGTRAFDSSVRCFLGLQHASRSIIPPGSEAVREHDSGSHAPVGRFGGGPRTCGQLNAGSGSESAGSEDDAA
jgi:hypothetical protein